MHFEITYAPFIHRNTDPAFLPLFDPVGLAVSGSHFGSWFLAISGRFRYFWLLVICNQYACTDCLHLRDSGVVFVISGLLVWRNENTGMVWVNLPLIV